MPLLLVHPRRQLLEDGGKASSNMPKKAVKLRRRCGSVLMYSIVAMVVLTAFVSFGVDFGRVQLAKTALQAAADAAARAGAAELSAGGTDAQVVAEAVAYAAANTVDGSPVVLSTTASPSDILIGNWDSTQTPKFSTTRTPKNAVNVSAARTAARGTAIPLVFGQIFGQRWCDIHVQVIATSQTTNTGVVGMGSVTMSGNAFIDSYNSNNGAYSAGSATSNGDVQSNGAITLAGGNTIYGDASPGPGFAATGGVVTGSRAPLTSTVSYPAASAGTYSTNNSNANVASHISNGDFNLSGSNSATMPAGVYYFNDFTMSGSSTVTVTGPTTIYVTGTTSISGSVVNISGTPSNLQFIVIGSHSVTLSGSSAFIWELYAPQSPVTLSGSAQIFGSVIGGSIRISGGSIHYDQALGSSGQVTIVQ
jgi:Flp pilus assembly protein TadG